MTVAVAWEWLFRVALGVLALLGQAFLKTRNENPYDDENT